MMKGVLNAIFLGLVLLLETRGNTILTHFKLMRGKNQTDVIKYLVKVCAGTDYIGVGISDTKKGIYEPLSKPWMKSRMYKNLFSYYEKIEVVEKFTRQPMITRGRNGGYFWNIPGPMPPGSQIIVTFTMRNPIAHVTLELIDDRFPDYIVLHYSLHVKSPTSIELKYNQYDYFWAKGLPVFNVDPSTLPRLNVAVMTIGDNSIHSTLNNGYPGDVPEPAPGENSMQLRFRHLPIIQQVNYIGN